MSRPLALYQDLEAVYRPQRVWAEGRASALVVAHFLSGVGAGGWLIGLVLMSHCCSACRWLPSR